MNNKRVIILILIFGFIRGSLYALSLPPWGLLDEEQHIDYILKIIQTGKPPIVGKDFIDPIVAKSVIDTQRHDKFHWESLASSDPKTWGLEGYSYEGYQGPLFYYLATPFYLMIPGNILDKLFGLRLLMVAISLITIGIIYKTTRELFPSDISLPYWAMLIAISLPERTSSTGRINNDVLLEIIAALFILMITRSILKGIDWKYAISLGLIGGLGILTKTSFVGLLALLPIPFIIYKGRKNIFGKALVASSIIILITIPQLTYSYLLYGDPTGFKGFSELYISIGNTLWNPHFIISNVIGATWKMFSSFWLVWWQGAEALYSPWLQAFWIVMLIASLLALVGLYSGRNIIFQKNRKRRMILISYLGVIIVFLFINGIGYFKGFYPVIQGRFILPVLIPIVLILCLGWRWLPKGNTLFIIVFIGLIIMDALSLFGNLLSYSYVQSSFYTNGQLISHPQLDIIQTITLFVNNFLLDKPIWVSICACLAFLAYISIIIGLIIFVFKNRDKFNSTILSRVSTLESDE